MPSSVTTGTQTAVITTEHTLTTQTTAATYVLVVDTTAMVAGDVLELRAKSKVLSSGSAIQDWCVSFANAQADPNKKSIPIPSVDSVAFTLKQVAGTGRDYPWNLYSL